MLGIKKDREFLTKIMAYGIDIALVRFAIILKHVNDCNFSTKEKYKRQRNIHF